MAKKKFINKKKKPTVKSLAKSVRKIQNMTDVKWSLNQFTSPSIVTTFGTVSAISLPLLNIVQGPGSSSRIGPDIQVTSISFNYAVITSDTVITDELFRIMIVRDKQSNGQGPVPMSFLSNTSGGTPSIMSSYDMSNNQRFRIIYNKIVKAVPHIADSGMGTTGTAPIIAKRFKKRVSFKVHYPLASNAPETNDLCIYFFRAGLSPISNANFELLMDARVNYKDL